MTLKTVVAFVIAYSLVLVCCTPVQTRFNIKGKGRADDTTSQFNTMAINTPTQIVVEQKEPEKPIEPPAKDTLVIVLNPENNTTNDATAHDLSRANELFELKDYKNALELYRAIVSRIEKTNPIYWDARFRYEECKIKLGRIDDGIEGIEFLIDLVERKSDIKEKLLLRFIRILNEYDKKDKAKNYLNVLKSEFPNSHSTNELEK